MIRLTDDYDADDESTDLDFDDAGPIDADDELGDELGCRACRQRLLPPQPVFPHVVAWVEGWWAVTISRRIVDRAGQGLSWDARWWNYPEVVARFKALHHTWEKAAASDDPEAMSNWFLNHHDRHLPIILDSDTGPMAHANKQNSFSGWEPFPTTSPAPEDLPYIVGDYTAVSDPSTT